MKYLFLLWSLAVSAVSFGQTKNCRDFREGKFKIVDTKQGTTTIIERKGSTQVEYQPGSPVKILAKVKWLDDCTYVLIPKMMMDGRAKTRLPKLVMTVQITETKSNSYIFRASIKNMEPLEQEMLRIE